MVKNIRNPILIAVLSFVLASCGQGSSGSSSSIIDKEFEWSVASSDNSITASVFQTTDGSIMYNVKKDGKSVIEDSRLGLQTEEADLQYLLTFDSKVENSRQIAYESISGKKTEYATEYNELILTFKEFDYFLDITFRTYNDGYAFRYGVRGVDESVSSTLTWEEEATEFALPHQSRTYAMAFVPSGNKEGYYWYSYEDYFNYRRSDRLGVNSYSMPFLYQTTDNVYSLISESNLIGTGYHGSFVKINNNDVLQTIYPDAHGKNPDLSLDLENGFVTPWRVGIVGTLGTIVESNLIEDVYDEVEYWRPENYDQLSQEQQATYNYDWVEPDVTAWNWLYYNGSVPQDDLDLQRKYIDLAAEMGWGWTIIDGGWRGSNTDSQIRELTGYAKSKNVKVAAWGHAFNDFGNEFQIRAKLSQWKQLGIDGVKVDFWDGQGATVVPNGQMEDKQTLELYEKFYQISAELQMIVNAHGSNKPTGERRVYPHVLNREAIRGNEFKTVSTEQTVYNTFIRATIGPSDFTPVVQPFTNGITAAHQMALNIMYESGTPSMADHEDRYREADYNEFFKQLPAVWNDIHYLEGDIEEYAVLARRHGDNWWVGGITARTAKSIDLDLSFIGDGEFEAKIYSDNGTTGPNSTVDVFTQNVTKNSKINVEMIEKGGFAIKIIKK